MYKFWSLFEHLPRVYKNTCQRTTAEGLRLQIRSRRLALGRQWRYLDIRCIILLCYLALSIRRTKGIFCVSFIVKIVLCYSVLCLYNKCLYLPNFSKFFWKNCLDQMLDDDHFARATNRTALEKNDCFFSLMNIIKVIIIFRENIVKSYFILSRTYTVTLRALPTYFHHWRGSFKSVSSHRYRVTNLKMS